MKTILILMLMLPLGISVFSQKLIYPEIRPGEEVLIEGTKANISGSLLLPKKEPDHKKPVFIFISGSGDFSYRSHFEQDAEYTFFKELSDLFLRRGFAVFLPDKRGINHSGGNWRKSGFKTYSIDITDIITYLKQRPELDPERIGLLGHSQGGYIAQITAAENPEDISVVINLAGPAQKVYHQVLSDMSARYQCEGIDGMKLKLRKGLLHTGLAFTKIISPAFKPIFLSHVIRHDPARYIQKIQSPVLTVYAENDYMVDHRVNETLMQKFTEEKAQLHTIYTLQNTNHHFLKSDTCFEWENLDKAINPQIFTLINNWLDEHFTL